MGGEGLSQLTTKKGERGGKSYHGLIRNRLDKRIKDPSKRMRANRRPAHRTGVLIHALLPIVADALHGGDAAVAIAAVVDVLACADGHFGQRLGRHFLRGFVNVGADGGPEAVDDVDEEEDEEEVEQELGVVGEDVWEVGVRVDEGEHGGDEPDLAWWGGWLRGRVRSVAAAGPRGVRVLVGAAIG